MKNILKVLLSAAFILLTTEHGSSMQPSRLDEAPSASRPTEEPRVDEVASSPISIATDMLHAAIRSKDISRVERAIVQGADVNRPLEKTENSPINVAIFFGNKDLFDLLMAVDDINLNPIYGHTPLHMAITTASCSIDDDTIDYMIQSLLKRGAVVKTDDLHSAMQYNREKLFKALLVACSEDIDATDEYGSTLLHVAVLNKLKSMIVHLIDRGANLNKPDKHKDTPFHYAAQSGNLEIVRLLADKGADPTLRNDKNQTPYGVAVARINDLPEYLMDHPEKSALVSKLMSDCRDIATFLQDYDKGFRRGSIPAGKRFNFSRTAGK
ncbi:MAG: ankyrin repeat domain-containing protein [Holosporaceae bacterium]|jgi:hypothetical protein|nr:ankyrin repeat domain-containing protein [Holosporaceae bacterium]